MINPVIQKIIQKIILQNMLDQVEVHVMVVIRKLKKILFVYQEKLVQVMDIHQLINGIILIVLKNIKMNFILMELLKRLFKLYFFYFV